jgi:photosystem II stability/assembly factor-like uncharacterized protein
MAMLWTDARRPMLSAGAAAALLATTALAAPVAGAPAGPAIDPARLQALTWRNIGPHRGGRVTTVAGIPSQPFTFYMGATGGGVWKTSDGGVSWANVSDGFFRTGSVGAIAVAPSDPDIVYVGMGEHSVRAEAFSHGDGVYKSTDGGKSWTHMGLAPTRQIAKVIVHPTDPDRLWVAAQGSPWGPHPERGVYRSDDGGKSWRLLLSANPDTGANDLAIDPRNPDILYAAMWQHRQKPWHGYQITSGGPGTGLFKSTDGGETWTRLGNGLPARAGKFAVAVSPADPNRLYALAEAKPREGGLFRSDDAGASWTLVNDAHVMTERSPYYMHVVAHPKDRDALWVLHAPFLKSVDGGKTFSMEPVPHGDNHDLWIHPDQPDWMIEANDGGANVSYNGGRSWSTQGNQPTAQFYRVSVDNLFPYNLYGGQQDNTTVKIASRSFDGGIGVTDWHDVGGGESAHIAFDPDRPELVYAGNYQGQITEFHAPTGRVRNVQAYPLQTAYRRGDAYPYRFNWNAPILASRHDPRIIYHAAHVVLRSDDRGQSWREISPDLTRDDPSKQGIVEGEFTTDGTAGSMYNTIFYLAESATARGELWAGTDDGRLHLTRDEGRSWTEITPPGLGETQINMIELSPHQPGKAYVVTTRYRFNDFTPSILRTEDYGRSWTRIVAGIPGDDFVRVVREDPKRKGLLFAGSETNLYLSLDDGAHWQAAPLNLPRVPITDLRVHSDDLVAATQGRAFWILDDIGPLRELGPGAPAGPRLYPPTPTEQVRAERSRDGGAGANPPLGSIIYYELPAGIAESDIALEILDASGRAINRFTGTKTPPRAQRLVSWYRPEPPRPFLTTRAGLNRFVWNWDVQELPDHPALRDYRGDRAYRVPPGRYRVRLTVGGQAQEQEFVVLPDPRLPVPAAAQAEKAALLAAIYGEADALQRAVEELRAIRAQLGSTARDRALAQRIGTWLDATIEESNPNFIDAGHSPERLDFNQLVILSMVDEMDAPITGGLARRVADVRAEWAKRRAEHDAILAEARAAGRTD